MADRRPRLGGGRPPLVLPQPADAGATIAATLGLARSTVARWPGREGRGCLARLDPPEPVCHGDLTVGSYVHRAIGPAEIVAIVGRNGSGNSILVPALIGLEPPTSGQVMRRPGPPVVPAAACTLSRTPEAMAALATLAGALAVVAGLTASLRLDTPAGPAIIVAACALFLLSLSRALRRR